MTTPTTTESNNPAPPASPVNTLLAKFKPFLILMAATLQAAADPCSCETCQLLRQNASNLAPLLLELANADA